MAKNPVEEAAWRVAEPVVASMGFELVDVEFVKQAQEWYLNVYVDKPGGIEIDECETVSHALDPLFDAEPAIADRHDYLVVSSPGLDRPLKTARDMQRALGQEIEVHLYAPRGGKKRYTGALAAYDEAGITLEDAQGTHTFTKKEIALVRRAITF